MATPRTYPTSNDAAWLTHAAWDAAESMDFDALEKWEREYESRAESDPHLCIGYRCKHYSELDDGEDEDGNSYPPNPYCGAAEEFLEDTGGMTTPVCVAPDKQEKDGEE